MGHGPVQPDWDIPDRGGHTTRPDDPFDGRRGPRATTGSPPGRGKGTGGHSSTLWCGAAEGGGGGGSAGATASQRWRRPPRRQRCGPATSCRSATMRLVSAFESIVLVSLFDLSLLLTEGFLMEQC
jgi:hypothetical protein